MSYFSRLRELAIGENRPSSDGRELGAPLQPDFDGSVSVVEQVEESRADELRDGSGAGPYLRTEDHDGIAAASRRIQHGDHPQRLLADGRRNESVRGNERPRRRLSAEDPIPRDESEQSGNRKRDQRRAADAEVPGSREDTIQSLDVDHEGKRASPHTSEVDGYVESSERGKEDSLVAGRRKATARAAFLDDTHVESTLNRMNVRPGSERSESLADLADQPSSRPVGIPEQTEGPPSFASEKGREVESHLQISIGTIEVSVENEAPSRPKRVRTSSASPQEFDGFWLARRYMRG